jgi:hypothetical protein
MSVFLKSYKQHVAGMELFVFSNKKVDECDGAGIHFFKYTADNFRDQYLQCLLQVPFDYILTFNDDYFLTGSPRYQEISNCIDLLEEGQYSHIRLVRGPNFSSTPRYPNLFPTDNKRPYFFSQTLSLWKRSDLIRVFEAVGPSGIGRKGKELQFEVLANQACEELDLKGLVYYENERKIGSAHYECNLVPHVVSAIVDGYWNTKEYSTELTEIEQELGLGLNPARYRKSFGAFFRRLFS